MALLALGGVVQGVNFCRSLRHDVPAASYNRLHGAVPSAVLRLTLRSGCPMSSGPNSHQHSACSHAPSGQPALPAAQCSLRRRARRSCPSRSPAPHLAVRVITRGIARAITLERAATVECCKARHVASSVTALASSQKVGGNHDLSIGNTLKVFTCRASVQQCCSPRVNLTGRSGRGRVTAIRRVSLAAKSARRPEPPAAVRLRVMCRPFR